MTYFDAAPKGGDELRRVLFNMAALRREMRGQTGSRLSASRAALCVYSLWRDTIRRREQLPPEGWSAAPRLLCRVVKSGDRVLQILVGCADGVVTAVAVEAPENGDVPDDHGHASIGEFQGPKAQERAFAASEKYISQWLKRRERLAKCRCKKISP